MIGVLFAYLVLSGFSGVALGDVLPPEADNAAYDLTESGTWVGKDSDWQYQLSDGEFLEKDWLFYSNKWYYLDEDGYMALGTKRIDGKYYYFRENGEMAVGWVYDEDTDKWYYMNLDGTRKTGWHEAGDVWYWFDSKGAMYNEGFRMVSGHKYYFFENGQMAAGKYLGTNYYGLDGLRDRNFDMIIQGDRKPSEDERNAISKAMENIPGEWMDRCLKSGWELMYYTDKEYFEAPKTDEGIFYVYHKTDINYKKIKFTKPESLVIAFGEYVADVTGNNKEENSFMVDFQQYLLASNLVQPLPSYFDDKPAMWFGLLFESGTNPEIFYDMKKKTPDLAAYIEETLALKLAGRKPTLEELRDNLYEESEGTIDAFGPSSDETLGKPAGPAQDEDEQQSGA